MNEENDQVSSSRRWPGGRVDILTGAVPLLCKPKPGRLGEDLFSFMDFDVVSSSEFFDDFLEPDEAGDPQVITLPLRRRHVHVRGGHVDLGDLVASMTPKEIRLRRRVWRKRHGGTLFALWPYAASGLAALRKRLPLMPRYYEHALAIAGALRSNPNIEIVPDPPQTPMMHLHLTRHRGRVQRGRAAHRRGAGHLQVGGQRRARHAVDAPRRAHRGRRDDDVLARARSRRFSSSSHRDARRSGAVGLPEVRGPAHEPQPLALVTNRGDSVVSAFRLRWRYETYDGHVCRTAQLSGFSRRGERETGSNKVRVEVRCAELGDRFRRR